jgi:hypothetical protein
MKKQSPAMLAKRLVSLMPNGIPRWIRCYDNGGDPDTGGSTDRYTVVFSGAACVKACGGEYPYRAMSGEPFHPQGVGMWGSTKIQPCDTMGEKPGWHWPPAIGRKCHLGKRIRFEDLPEDCRKLVVNDYLDVWNLRPGHYYGELIEEAK